MRLANMGCRRRSATAESGGAELGVFAWVMEGLASEAAVPKTVMIDATYQKANHTASSLRVKKGGADGPLGAQKAA